MAPSLDTDEDVGLLRIGLFFDGTRNNAHNLARGRPQPPQPRPAQLRADDDSTYQSRLTSSYDNGLTNIARLQQLYPDSRSGTSAAPSLSIYVEGVGTRNDADDDLIGLAFGIGASGVRAKVRRALQVLLPAALGALATRWQRPLRGVQLDLFGFSRGAAAARDVANQLQAWDRTRWRQLLQAAGLSCTTDFAPADPPLRFIGLFDTVVAVSGGRADEQPHLALHAGVARQVLQLSARDEHRQHYPLTSVAPAFTEIALPGVHANIGGGYNQLEEGPKLLSRPRRQLLRRPSVAEYQTPPLAILQATTAYAEAQADAERWRQQLGLDQREVWVDVWHQWQQQRRAGSRSVVLSPVLYVTAAVVLRRRIDWRYQLIALQVMQQHAIDAGVQWTANANAVPGWELPSALQPIARRLVAGQPLTQTQEALLRRRYLMQSAHWNFDALGDTALTYAADAGVSELPYRPGPGLFYINRPTVDGKRVVLPNA
ncbi:DUF2235 domain-containing protein [Stenotrophomonas sepilia]|uniref:phospholipase effector Tle1 domain-containing protein n=1 Tax=Stenotrophomonas sepilia TaxID=2860290 RepID=UPI0032087D8D